MKLDHESKKWCELIKLHFTVMLLTEKVEDEGILIGDGNVNSDNRSYIEGLNFALHHS